MGSWVERTCGKVVAGARAADYGAGWARLQLADPGRQWLVDPGVPHSHTDKPGGTKGEQNRLCNPEFQHWEIKPQTTD